MTLMLTDLEAQLAGADGPRIRQQAVQVLAELRGRYLRGPQTLPPGAEASQKFLRRQTVLSACDAALRVLQANGVPVAATQT